LTTPLITNIAPIDGSVAPIGAPTRFSLRDAVTEIDRSTMQLFLGTGPVFYRGGELPEEVEPPPTMTFQALSGSPGVLADRSILSDDYLRIDKNTPSQNQEAVYFMGGLEAPAEPTDSLMAEFTLRLNSTEVTVDGTDFCGVLVGLLINNSGLTVKFFTNAGTQRIEIHSAELTATTPPSGSYVSSFDWDEAVALNADGSNTYKLLWCPEQDLVKLYVKDASSDTDQLLITGAVSDFPTLPSQEQRDHQPWLFFGHGNYPTQVSISEWKDVYLFNIVTNPILDGIVRGEHITSIVTNNQTYYEGADLPGDAPSAWQSLPSSFGTIGGGERVGTRGLVLERTSLVESIGYYRAEPKVTEKTSFDIKISGEVLFQDVSVETTGIEVYIDDGTRQARLAFLQDSSGEQGVGILLGTGVPSLISSYESEVVGFSIERTYRLVLTPGVSAELFILTETGEGVEISSILQVSYSSLPVSGMPGPGLGFLHNANSGAATARMVVRQVRYSTDIEAVDWEDFISSSPSWTKVGSGDLVPSTLSSETNSGSLASIVESGGVVTVSGLTGISTDAPGNYLEILNGDHPGIYRIITFIDPTSVVIDNPSASGADSGNPSIWWNEIIDPSFVRMSDASNSDNTYLKKEYATTLQPNSGWTLEFRARIYSYNHDETLSDYGVSGTDLVRVSTGFVAQVLDGTNRASLVFADAGPDIGKIVLLSTFDTVWENLLAIRSGNTGIEGTYYAVDWTKFHLYRLEKNIGGSLRLFVDESVSPVINIEERLFDYPAHTSGGNPRVEIGHSESGILTVSDIQNLSFCISDGYDVSSAPVLSEQELLTRFNHGTDALVEIEDV
jgi:hypothetical protein